MFDTCSCQTARCFNKSKGVLITGSKLKAFRNPQPSWGFSVHNKMMPIYNKLASNTQENSHLIQLRDWLLPLLMNGQVTVK
ncbi:hypothetical protein COD29_20520 [Escherichia coli]|nr:hypothetical protein COD29_20520 [Escherichia coli]